MRRGRSNRLRLVLLLGVAALVTVILRRRQQAHPHALARLDALAAGVPAPDLTEGADGADGADGGDAPPTATAARRRRSAAPSGNGDHHARDGEDAGPAAEDPDALEGEGAERRGDGGAGTPWVDPDDGVCPSTHPVKGNLRSGIYHLPGMVNYERTHAERCYVDAAAAEGDGLRASKR